MYWKLFFINVNEYFNVYNCKIIENFLNFGENIFFRKKYEIKFI